MNSLTANSRLPQLRGIPVPGTTLFRYERMVSGRWVACNHSRAASIVGVYSRRARALCRNLTASTKTHEVSLSMSLVTTGKNSRSFSCARATRMSACSPLSGSGKSLKEWTPEWLVSGSVVVDNNHRKPEGKAHD